jgi:hypothetical protein
MAGVDVRKDLQELGFADIDRHLGLLEIPHR